MPLANDPTAEIKIILDSDKGKDAQPLFFCRVLTARQQRKVLEMLSETATLPAVAAIDKTFEALDLCLIKNADGSRTSFPGGMDPMDTLTAAEAMELVTRTVNYLPGLDDKKKSE
jgi:hypothetical protein